MPNRPLLNANLKKHYTQPPPSPTHHPVLHGLRLQPTTRYSTGSLPIMNLKLTFYSPPSVSNTPSSTQQTSFQTHHTVLNRLPFPGELEIDLLLDSSVPNTPSNTQQPSSPTQHSILDRLHRNCDQNWSWLWSWSIGIKNNIVVLMQPEPQL
eukprot:7744110-Pyramimonas_sp.AAC.1